VYALFAPVDVKLEQVDDFIALGERNAASLLAEAVAKTYAQTIVSATK
jgi:hypothetical protein